MRRMLVSRISRRVLAEHHLALSQAFEKNKAGKIPPGVPVGIIHTELNVKECIERCVAYLRSRPYDADHDLVHGSVNVDWSQVVIDGQLDTTFAYIREHFE